MNRSQPRSALLLVILLSLAPPLFSQAEKNDTLIQLANNPVSDVLAVYEQLTGKQVIKEANIPNATIQINVTEPVTREAAAELIEASLLLNGFVIVPGSGNSVKVVSIAGGGIHEAKA